MKKLSLITILIVILQIVLTTVCLGYTVNQPQEITIVEASGSSNTDSANSLRNLYDGNPYTVWSTKSTSPATAWVELKLRDRKFIDYLDVESQTGVYGAISILYIDSNGIWQPFIGKQHIQFAKGRIDLSLNHAKTDGLRFVFYNGTNQASLGNIGEICVFGHASENLVLLPDQISVSREVQGYPARFLNDGNTYTSWRVPGNGNSETVNISLTETTTVHRVKFYSHGGSGLLSCSVLSGGNWVNVSNLNLSNLRDGWHNIEIQDLISSALKFDLTPNGAYLGGLNEIEVWSEGATESKETVLGENLTGINAFGINLGPFDNLDEVTLWVTLAAGTSGFNPHLYINGLISNPAISLIDSGDYVLAGIPVDPNLLYQGKNIITLDLGAVTAIETDFIVSHFSGTLQIAGINCGSLPGLMDDRLFEGYSTTTDSLEIQLNATADINDIQLYGFSPVALSSVTLWVWQAGQWQLVDPGTIQIDDMHIILKNGTGLVQKLKLQANPLALAALTEIRVYGSGSNQGASQVNITGPAMYSVITGNTFNLEGYVDNPDATITIDGNSVVLQGHYFTYPVNVSSPNDGSCKSVSIIVTDSGGQSSQVVFSYNTSSPPVIGSDLTESFHTNSQQLTVTGTVDTANTVTINTVPATCNGGNYIGQVDLNEGANRLLITAMDGKGAVSQITRQVIRDTQAPFIRVASPLNGEMVYTDNLTIKGTCSDVTATRIIVNGQPASINNDIFDANVTLTAGNNDITFQSIDESGNTRSLTLHIILDTGTGSVESSQDESITINLTAPVEGAIIPRSTININGKVNGENFASLTINGFSLEVGGDGSFQTDMCLVDGQHTLVIVSKTVAGTTVTRNCNIIIDTTPPVFSKMQMTPTGSTNNPWPVFVFKAQDMTSGIEHYEIRLDGGAWIGPVNSPYAFANALSDGAHLIEVKAIDKAGNEIITKLNTGSYGLLSAASVQEDETQVSYGPEVYNSLINQYTDVNFESGTPDSPFQSYFEKNQEIVSGSSGMLNVSAIDLELPGRNGFDLSIKRVYSSAEVINIGNYYIHKTNEVRHILINTFGDGWSLNIPWIERIGAINYLHLPEGQVATIKYDSNNQFEYHEGVHFILQKNATGDYTLNMGNGIYYTLDSSGKPTLKWDTRYPRNAPNGKRTEIQYYYNNSQLSKIVDSIGRNINFYYITINNKSVIDHIEVNGGTSDLTKTVQYTYDSNGLLKSVKDPLDRTTSYGYIPVGLVNGLNFNIYRSYTRFKYEHDDATNIDYFRDMDYSTADQNQTINQNSITSISITLLNSIAYPTGIISSYLYQPYGQDTGQHWWNQYTAPGDPQYWSWVETDEDGNLIKAHHGYYRYDYTDDINGLFRGNKIVVSSHSVGGKNTGYAYTMNYYSGSMHDGTFFPMNSYIISYTATDSATVNGKTVKGVSSKESYQQLYKKSNGGYQLYNYMYFNQYPQAQDNYRGPVTVSRQTINNGTEFETVTYGYDSSHLPILAFTNEIYSRGGKETYRITYNYDNWGNITSKTNSLTSLQETTTYYTGVSGIKNLVSVKTLKNKNPITGTYATVTTNYGYDSLGKPVQATITAGSQTLIIGYQYYGNSGETGSLKSITEPNGLKTDFTYDDTYLAFLKTKTAHASQYIFTLDSPVAVDIVTLYSYNYFGLKVAETDPRGLQTQYSYDKSDRIIRIDLPSDNSNSVYRQYTYNDSAKICRYRNENGQETLYQYDGLGRLASVTKYLTTTAGTQNIVTGYAYDALGRVTGVTDPKNQITSYEYDSLGRITKVIFPDDTPATTTDNPSAALSYNDITSTVTLTDEEGGTVTETKDWAGRLVEAIQNCKYRGVQVTYTWKFTYDSKGNKIRMVAPGPDNNPANISQVDQEFDSLGHLVKSQGPTVSAVLPGMTQPQDSRPTVIYEYDIMGHCTKEVSADGYAISPTNPGNHVVEKQYDNLGRLFKTTTKATDILSNRTNTVQTKYLYDAGGNKTQTQIHNPATSNQDKTWSYEYSVRSFLLSETSPDGYTTRYQYDNLGNKTAVTDPRGNGTDGKFTTWYVYDDLNRLVKTVLPDDTPPVFNNGIPDLANCDNPYTTTGYDVVGNKTNERDVTGVVSNYEYTARNWVQRVVDALNREVAFYTYDRKGNRTQIRDASGNITRNEYDSLGRLRLITYPDQAQIESFNYNGLGKQISKGDSFGNYTQYTYNALGWLTGVTDPLNRFIHYTYDPNGNMLAVTAPNQLTTSYQYDELNRLIRKADSQNHKTKYSYDLLGNKSRMNDPRGTDWVYQYNGDNLLQSLSLTGIDNSTYTLNYTYDDAGNLMQASDDGGSIRYNYVNNIYQSDPQNRLTAVDRSFDNAHYRTEYRYDNQQLTGIKYPEANGWLDYHYNTLGRLDQVNGFTPTNGITYGADGTLQGINYTNGVTTAYKYDIDQRLKEIVANGPAGQILKQVYIYDLHSNIIGINDNIYSYDTCDQLTGAITVGKFIENTATPGTPGVKLADVLGDAALDFTTDIVAAVKVDYYASSIGMDFGSGVPPAVKQIQLVPDAAHQTNRLAENALEIYTSGDNQTYSLLPKEQWDYRKDSEGTVTIIIRDAIVARYLKLHVIFDERNPEYGPDDYGSFLNQLANMLRLYQEAPIRTESYHYDDGGNRTQLRVRLVNDDTTFDSIYYANSNWLKTDGRYAYVYDAAGNLIKKGNAYTPDGNTFTFITTGEEVIYWEYEYDLLSRLTKVSKNGVVVSEYSYDPTGLRIVKRARGETIHYVFEGTEPIFEKNVSTGKIKSYVYALGKHLARVDGVIGDTAAKKYWFTLDHIGSVKVVTDEIGKTVWSADYLAFGTRFGENGDSEFDEWHGFTGKEYDPDIEMDYFNARWYDPQSGRFISEDPAEDPNNPNLYAYGRNNPLTYTDPTGEVSGVDDLGLFLGGGLINAGIELGSQSWHNNYDWTKVFTAFLKGGLSAWIGEYTGGVGGIAVYAFLDSTEATVRNHLERQSWDGSFGVFARTFMTDMVSGIAGGALGHEIGQVFGKLQGVVSQAFSMFETKFAGRIGNEIGEVTENLPQKTTEIVENFNNKPLQEHHFSTNKSQTYTPQIEGITNKYGLDLDESWNKDYLAHQGRHSNQYHEFMITKLKEFDSIAKGNKEIFLKLYEQLKQNIKQHPEMLYKDYWR